MKNKKLLFILIPVIIVVLALIAGIVFLTLNGRPESIFKTAINTVFNTFENSSEQYSTIKGTMNLTASMDTENEELKTINSILEGASIGLNMEVDTANIVINENLNVVFNNENLIDAEIILQDQKGYVYIKEYLDKYLEIPQENMEYSDLTAYYDKIATLDQNALIEAIREELIKSISSREFTREKVEKRKASILDLSQEDFSLLSKEILENLKQNENFNNALGQCKDDVLAVIDDMIEDYEDSEYDESSRVIISIYTEGLLNKFAGFSIELKDEQDINLGMLLAFSEQNYEFMMYEQYDGEQEDIIKVRVEDRKENKNKGIATITMKVDEEQYVATYSYEKKGKQTIFELSTEIEGVGIGFSGDTTESGKNIRGNFAIIVQQETLGKATLNCEYDFTYGVQVQKVNTRECSIN